MNNRSDSNFQPNAGRFTRSLSAPQVITYLGIMVFACLLITSAWLHEDAFITLRTVDNFINGYGLRYNIVERVQTYTHPLWMFALILPYTITREPLYSTVFLSIITSVLALFLLLRFLAPTLFTKIVALLILISSRPYIDYGTAGLENPMSHLLLVSFCVIYFTRETSLHSLFILTLLASLAGLNRLDTILIFVPPLFVYYLHLRGRKALLALLLGAVPLIIWTLFSLFYYGFPFPNSAYAKLNTHIAPLDLFIQGTYYYKDLFIRDPLTFLTMVLGLAITFVERNRFRLALAAGLILYLLYILRIGGDYMSGRFFTVPLLTTVVLLVQTKWLNEMSRRGSFVLIGIVLILGFLSADPVLLPFSTERNIREERGITNERLFYEDYTGLMANLRGETTIDQHFLARSGTHARNDGESVMFRGGIGLAGYFAGPQVQVVDSLALSDVLLARLPVGNPKYWRIGHFKRVNPAGFKDSIRSGENVILDPQLASLYDIFQRITQDPLLDRQRLTAIWQVNTGQYANLLDADGYVFDQIRPLSLKEICGHVGETLEENDTCISNVPHQGFIVDFQEKRHDSSVEFALDGNYDYEFFFLDGEAIIGHVLDEAVGSSSDELVLRKIDVPEDVSLDGFNALWMRPIFIGLDPENPRMIGQIKLINESATIPNNSYYERTTITIGGPLT